jgi:hypothetical protein
LKTTATEDQTIDPAAWEDEEEQAMGEKQLKPFLSRQDVEQTKNGHPLKTRAGSPN